MSKPFDDLLSKACEEYLSDPENVILPEQTVELTADEIHQLAEKILLLPPDLHDILFFRYLFNSTPKDTEVMLEVTDAKSKLYFALGLLAQAMGFEDARIGVDSMTAACKLALERYTEPPEVLETPRYSAKFRHSLRKIKAARPAYPSLRSFARHVAAFALAITVGAASIVSTNAGLKEDFFYWIRESFEKFSVFEPQTPDQTNEPLNITPIVGYLPEGFALTKSSNTFTTCILEYENSTSDKIHIEISTNSIYLNTESVEINEAILNNSKVEWWKQGDLLYFIWNIDTLSCFISAKLSYEETYKVAESIALLE